MATVRTTAAIALLFTAACSSRRAPGAPEPVRGENGPGASINVDYTGGILMREVEATFRVDDHAFAVVGHLGGDGVLRIVSPEVPDPFITFAPKRTYRTSVFSAGFDGAPSLHSFTMSPFRTMGARFDSYDGRGYGFVFIVATRSPMRLDQFSDGFDWLDLDARDYFQTSDPRAVIRAFAERLAGRQKYTLRFAKAYTTRNFSGYADRAWDCDVLSSSMHLYLNRFWGSWGAFGLGYSEPFSGGCGRRYYASYGYSPYWMASFDPIRRSGDIAPPLPRVPGVGPGPQTPTPGPVLTRPKQRAFGEKTIATRTAYDRTGRTSASRSNVSTYISRDDGRSVARRDIERGRSYDPPSRTTSSSNGRSSHGGGSASAGGAARSAPVASPPRSTPTTTSTPASSTPPATGTKIKQ